MRFCLWVRVIIVALSSAVTARAEISTEKFRESLNLCAAGSKETFDANLIGDISDLYEGGGRKIEGFARRMSAAAFWAQIPMEKRHEAYQLYLKCIESLFKNLSEPSIDYDVGERYINFVNTGGEIYDVGAEVVRRITFAAESNGCSPQVTFATRATGYGFGNGKPMIFYFQHRTLEENSKLMEKTLRSRLSPSVKVDILQTYFIKLSFADGSGITHKRHYKILVRADPLPNPVYDSKGFEFDEIAQSVSSAESSPPAYLSSISRQLADLCDPSLSIVPHSADGPIF